MRTILGIVGLMIGSGIGGFWSALFFCALGIFIGHRINANRAESSFAADPWQDTPIPSTDTLQTEDIPDLTTPRQFRAYLAQLTARLHALEREVAALKRGPIPVAPTATTPQPAPSHDHIASPAFPTEPRHQPSQEPFEPEVPPALEIAPPSLEMDRSVDAVATPAAASPADQEPVEDHAASLASEEPISVSANDITSPSLFSRLISGNIVAKVGVVVLFFGVGFLLKFAYDYGLMPPEVRLIGVALVSALLFRFGWTMLETRWLYGLILQGGASGLAYIDVFFALKTYGFISPTLGFGLFMALGVLTTILAVRQDAKPLAVLGLMGAFLAPILASTGSGNHVLLFSYYTLLSLFILAVSWFKTWRELNLTGWAFTFPIGFFWGWSNYRPELFASTEPFLLIFFGIYLIIPILFATRQPPELKGFVDGTLVFGTPAAAAFMQSGLVEGMEYGLAWSAAFACALYGALALLVIRREKMRLLGETYCALSVGFGTLAIFFAFGAYTTFALWTIEGAAILWVGLRQETRLARLFGLFVQMAGALYFFIDYGRYDRSSPLFNDAVLGCAIIAVASTISAALMRRYADRISEDERTLGNATLLWGALWWSLGGLDAIHHGVPHTTQAAVAILFFSASFAATERWGAVSDWIALRCLSAVHPLVLFSAVLSQAAAGIPHPFADNGWLAWPAGLGVLFWTLHRQRADDFNVFSEIRTSAGWVILIGIVTWEAEWLLMEKHYIDCLLLALAGYLAGYLRFHLRERDHTAVFTLSNLLLAWATCFWFLAGLGWIHESFSSTQTIMGALVFAGMSSLLYELAATWLNWPALRWPALTIWVAMPFAAGMQYLHATHPLANWGWAVWPMAWVCALYGLYREERDGRAVLSEPRHAVALWLPLIVATWELHHWTETWNLGQAWRVAALAFPSVTALIAALQPSIQDRWPLTARWPLYRDFLFRPVAIAIGLWTVIANLKEPGSMAPLPYLPLFNPLDLMIAASLYALATWRRSIEPHDVTTFLEKALAVLGFIWLNAVAFRSIHYWAGVPYRIDQLLDDILVQATLSILWTSTALVLMLLARRRMKRQLWLLGAALLGVVVAKLFLVDLANSGTVARIVSFLVVGVLLLVIGYAAPVPPGEKETGAEDKPRA